MNGPCIAFFMEDAMEAWGHFRRNLETAAAYGDSFEGKDLYTWDAGERTLCRCRRCGGYVLRQESEFHGTFGDDSYYGDFFPVSGPEEAEGLNRRWDGWEIEDEFPGRYLVQDNDCAPHWAWGRKEDPSHGSGADRKEHLSGEKAGGTDPGAAFRAAGADVPGGEQMGERQESAGSGKPDADG